MNVAPETSETPVLKANSLSICSSHLQKDVQPKKASQHVDVRQINFAACTRPRKKTRGKPLISVPCAVALPTTVAMTATRLSLYQQQKKKKKH